MLNSALSRMYYTTADHTIFAQDNSGCTL